MRKNTVTGFVAVAFVVVGVAAGCGGSDSETDAAATDTASSAASPRLTVDQWAAYEAVATPFEAANQAMLKKFDSCPRSGTGDTTVFAKCLGDTLQTAEAAGRGLGATLAGFNAIVSGPCATSLAAYSNYTTPYLASVTSVQSAIDTENAAALTNASTNLEQTLAGGKEEKTSFEADCKPA